MSQSEYNISSEETGRSLFTVTSNLRVTAVKSSHVDCLASVSALPTPLSSSVRLTVGETTQPLHQETYALHTCTQLSPLSILSLSCLHLSVWFSLSFFFKFVCVSFSSLTLPVRLSFGKPVIHHSALFSNRVLEHKELARSTLHEFASKPLKWSWGHKTVQGPQLQN